MVVNALWLFEVSWHIVLNWNVKGNETDQKQGKLYVDSLLDTILSSQLNSSYRHFRCLWHLSVIINLLFLFSILPIGPKKIKVIRIENEYNI